MHVKNSSNLPSLWLPKSYADLNALRDDPSSRVVCTQPGVIVKYRGEFAEEVLALRFARSVLPNLVPKILHHPQPPRGRHSTTHRVWYICMEKCPGVPLEAVIDDMSVDELDHIAEQLKTVLSTMSKLTSKSLGSVTGGPYRNFFYPSHLSPKYPFSSVGEFIDSYRQILLLFCTESFTESLLSQLPRNDTVQFTHGDLLPKNILVNGSEITAIVDWATAGFYPAYWEYCRMYDPHFSSKGWDYVLDRIFHIPRRLTEIYAVKELLGVQERFFYVRILHLLTLCGILTVMLVSLET
ncbi:hypothetical protein Agabi119p4_8370 [Agaricus bisporus var. burnettii]|uniref:Aminoglycoside phosphotransferase domain-containing protein n=1 Tax=Agaricus bisporus var. burnettii TaxID=192524 RepID=A0A8H7C5Q1_AGABI|nr:hypothetical protein Agabi119p4_8370 [Agaricus bisporus var. burnettii]